jgi:hypothetical protein
MDSWTPAQIEIMKAGGNDTCNQFLYSRGVPRNASIREKYSSDAAALYKQVLKARAEKRPEPTELIVVTEPKKKDVNVVVVGGRNTHTTATATTGTTLSTASNKQDPNGMERLHGETDAEYIARQTRLREEARKRMAQKFGTMDGSNGKRIMGGIGSSPHPSSSSSSSSSPFAPSSFMDVSSLTNTLSSGLGTAASGLSSVFSFASNTVNNSGAREVAKDVGNMGLELWSTISSSAKEVASNLNMEVGIGSRMEGGHDGTTANDGLSALSEKMKMEKLARGTSSRTFTGFGSDTVMSGNNGASVGVGVATSSSTSNSTSASSTTTRVDQNSVAPLPGESDGDYMTRQMRIRQEAQAKSIMANNMVKVAPAPPSLSKTTTTTTVQEPQKASSSLSSSKAKKLQLDSDDDFFASFGA